LEQLLLFRLANLLLLAPVIGNLLLGTALISPTGGAEDGAAGSPRQGSATGVAGDGTARRAHQCTAGGAAGNTGPLD
jgi:hypothetical protein